MSKSLYNKKNNIQSEIDKAHKNIQQAILQH
jgi:hypothetical protein